MGVVEEVDGCRRQEFPGVFFGVKGVITGGCGGYTKGREMRGAEMLMLEAKELGGAETKRRREKREEFDEDSDFESE